MHSVPGVVSCQDTQDVQGSVDGVFRRDTHHVPWSLCPVKIRPWLRLLECRGWGSCRFFCNTMLFCDFFSDKNFRNNSSNHTKAQIADALTLCFQPLCQENEVSDGKGRY